MHREPQTLYKITSLCKSGCTPMILIRFSPTEAVLFTLEINLYAPLFCHGFSILFCLEKLVWMPPDGWLNALYGASFSEQNKISHFSFKCVHHIEILFVCALPWHCLALHKGSRYKLDDLINQTYGLYELCHAITFTTPRHKMKIHSFFVLL